MNCRKKYTSTHYRSVNNSVLTTEEYVRIANDVSINIYCVSKIYRKIVYKEMSTAEVDADRFWHHNDQVLKQYKSKMLLFERGLVLPGLVLIGPSAVWDSLSEGRISSFLNENL